MRLTARERWQIEEMVIQSFWTRREMRWYCANRAKARAMYAYSKKVAKRIAAMAKGD